MENTDFYYFLLYFPLPHILTEILPRPLKWVLLLSSHYLSQAVYMQQDKTLLLLSILDFLHLKFSFQKSLSGNQNIKQNDQKENYHQDNIFSFISGKIMVLNEISAVIHHMLHSPLHKVQRLRYMHPFSLAALFLTDNPLKASKGYMSNSEFHMIHSQIINCFKGINFLFVQDSEGGFRTWRPVAGMQYGNRKTHGI